jgi:hypothetical protein
LHVFRLAERILEHGHHIRPLRAGGIVRYEIGPLPRGCLTQPSRPAVCAGEPVVILHFDNQSTVALAATTQSRQAMAWAVWRVASADLAVLAEMTRTGAIPPGVRAVWAETLIHPALARAGFTTRPAPPSLRTPFARLFLFGLLAIYGHDGLLENGRSRRFRLGEAWMGLEELQRRFGTHLTT